MKWAVGPFYGLVIIGSGLSRMEFRNTTVLQMGDWSVDTKSGVISRDGETIRLEFRALRLLLCLAEHPSQVVSIDDLLTYVWPGVTVSPDSVYQAVASLRRVLGDDPKEPTYIATVPRLGYRMIAAVTPLAEEPAISSEVNSPLRRRVRLALAAAFCVALGSLFLFHGQAVNRNHAGPPPQKAVAVLPFLDLTEGMKQEEFADGMTEELIDKISKLSGF